MTIIIDNGMPDTMLIMRPIGGDCKIIERGVEETLVVGEPTIVPITPSMPVEIVSGRILIQFTGTTEWVRHETDGHIYLWITELLRYEEACVD
jgi:hypothetical protein